MLPSQLWPQGATAELVRSSSVLANWLAAVPYRKFSLFSINTAIWNLCFVSELHKPHISPTDENTATRKKMMNYKQTSTNGLTMYSSIIVPLIKITMFHDYFSCKRKMNKQVVRSIYCITFHLVLSHTVQYNQ